MTIAPLLLLPLALQASGDALERCLADARDAAAYAALRATPLVARGTADRLGTEGAFELELHPGGAFRYAVRSALPLAVGSDGERVWSSDWSGLARPLELGDRERALLLAAVLGGRWLDPEPPVTVALADPPAEDGAVALELGWKGGEERARLLLDAATHRVRALELSGATWHLERWDASLGFPFPDRLRVVERGGAEETYAIERLERADDLDAAALGLPPGGPGDARFDSAAPPAVEARRARTGHLLVHPTVAGRDVGWFLLDSGAGALCLTPEAGDALGLPLLGQVTAAGIGGSVRSAVRRGGPLVLGPLEIADPTWVELDLAFLEPFLGVPVAGIAGYDLFARAIVAVDARGPKVELFPPSAWSPPEGARVSRLVLANRIPCVEASFEGGRSGLFRLDTGSDGTVTFHHGAVGRLGLLAGRETQATRSGGVGGFAAVETGELAFLELGGRRFAPLTVLFETRPGEQRISDYVCGTIGGALLEPFTLAFDYPGGRIAFVPRPDPEEDSEGGGG